MFKVEAEKKPNVFVIRSQNRQGGDERKRKWNNKKRPTLEWRKSQKNVEWRKPYGDKDCSGSNLEKEDVLVESLSQCKGLCEKKQECKGFSFHTGRVKFLGIQKKKDRCILKSISMYLFT